MGKFRFLKDNLKRRQPTPDEIEHLVYPKDKFDLISVDYVDTWDYHKISTSTDNPDAKKYTYKHKTVFITVKCKRCGSIKKEAADREDMSCSVGPCAHHWKDITGQRFGKLVVESLDFTKTQKKQKKNAWYWKCKCDCGNYCYKTNHSLVSNYHRCCPECSRKSRVEKNTLPDGLSKWRRMIRIYKKNARFGNREFTLTEQQFVDVAKQNCAYCGSSPKLGSYGVVCNGIDRIDSTKGYTPENSVACCYRCNYMKNKLTTPEFFEHVKRIYDFSIANSKFNDHPEMEYASSEAEKGASHASG